MDLTPQQQAFLSAYLNPKSPTWSNAYQSAITAGYKDEYAKTITAQMPEWLSENINRGQLVSKAEKNLEKALEGKLDEVGKKLDIMWKATDFTLSRLKKDVYSERQELTGADGTPLQVIVPQAVAEAFNINATNTEARISH